MRDAGYWVLDVITKWSKVEDFRFGIWDFGSGIAKRIDS